MDKNEFSNLGDQIKNIVEDVVDTRNFERLNKDIGDTVNSALWEVHNRLQGRGGIPNVKVDKEKINNERQTSEEQRNWQMQRREEQRNREREARQNVQAKANERIQLYKRNQPLPISKSPAGGVAGILYLVFGYIGVGVTSLLLFIFMMVTFAGEASLINGISLGVLLPILGGSLIMVSRGSFLRKRIRRFKKYVIQLNGKTYCSIKQLASHLGQSEKYVAKDLKKMIHLGMFPQGHIDDKRTCLMLTADTYEQYLKSQEELDKRQQEAVVKQSVEESTDESTKEFKLAMEEGKNYIRQIKEVNDAIPEVELSNKLYRLEMVISKIFDHVERHPDQMAEIHKFMSYYLPTTLKLMNAYKEFDTQPIQGDNISTAKNEIRKTLDTINLAFENLLDSLFEDAALDVSTDISVLETMLAQEGLTEKDFATKQK